MPKRKYRKHKGKRKGRKHKKKARGTSFRGEIKYTPCRNSKGMFTRKPACKR